MYKSDNVCFWDGWNDKRGWGTWGHFSGQYQWYSPQLFAVVDVHFLLRGIVVSKDSPLWHAPCSYHRRNQCSLLWQQQWGHVAKARWRRCCWSTRESGQEDTVARTLEGDGGRWEEVNYVRQHKSFTQSKSHRQRRPHRINRNYWPSPFTWRALR